MLDVIINKANLVSKTMPFVYSFYTDKSIHKL